MTIREVKQILKITNKDIAKFFGYKSRNSYQASSAKKKIEKGIVEIYKRTKAYSEIETMEPAKWGFDLKTSFNQDGVSLEDIGLPTEILNSLRAVDITMISQLLQYRPQELQKIRGLGKKSIKIISEKLNNKNIHLLE